jgi:hypothetical protein
MWINKKVDSSDNQSGSQSPFLYLMTVILAMILTTPFLLDYVRLRILLDIFYSIIFITAIYAVGSYEKQHITFAALLAVPMILSLWAKYLLLSDSIIIGGTICGIMFFAFAIYHSTRFIFKSPYVTKEVISAAVVIYLLMALMWEFIYSLLELYQPGSFNILDGHSMESRTIFLYYSFVTITTLGYGDITPLTEKAKSLTILEAFIGQMYLVVVVAWLVGMHVSRKSK